MLDDEIKIISKDNGLLIKSQNPLYVFANRAGYDFVYSSEFDNHYLNFPYLEEVILKEDGLCIISTMEIIKDKYFTNISLILDIDLDNLTMINLYRIIAESITATSWKLGAVNEDELYNEFGNYYNTIFIACKNKSDVQLPFDISLYYQVKDLVDRSLKKCFRQITDYEK